MIHPAPLRADLVLEIRVRPLGVGELPPICCRDGPRVPSLDEDRTPRDVHPFAHNDIARCEDCIRGGKTSSVCDASRECFLPDR